MYFLLLDRSSFFREDYITKINWNLVSAKLPLVVPVESGGAECSKCCPIVALVKTPEIICKFVKKDRERSTERRIL